MGILFKISDEHPVLFVWENPRTFLYLHQLGLHYKITINMRKHRHRNIIYWMYVQDWMLIRFKFLMISITKCPHWKKVNLRSGVPYIFCCGGKVRLIQLLDSLSAASNQNICQRECRRCHLQKIKRNYRKSCMLSTDRIDFHQSQPLVWPSDLL